MRQDGLTSWGGGRVRGASTRWPRSEAFLDTEEGDISLGSMGYNPQLGYTAIVSDEHNMLVALVRRPRETLHQLLDRVEKALGPAIDEQILVDEINGPSTPIKTSRRR